MNNQIIHNLYELWEQIGEMTNTIFKAEDYTAVSIRDSDWPDRIFNLENAPETLTRIVQLSTKGKAPKMLTIPKPNDVGGNLGFEFVMEQKNMALDLKSFAISATANAHIKRVRSEDDARIFAETASKSFGYKVDPKVISEIIKSTAIKLFIYQESTEGLGCGLVFFDSNGIAGLHMIGTVPSGRGKGIGKSMTEHLLMEANDNNASSCVLHASKMGESIYKRFGFQTYGEIETYRIKQ